MRNCSFDPAVLLLLGLALAGCSPPDEVPEPPQRPAAAAAAGLTISAIDARPGDTVAIGLVAAVGEERPAGVQGRIAFDAGRLRYLGQRATAHLVLVNLRNVDAGLVRLIAVRIDGLPSPAADLRFEVLAPDYVRGLGFQPEQVVGTDLQTLTAAVSLPLRAEPFEPATPRRLTAEDWVAMLDPAAPPRSVVFLAGQGTIYGDVNQSGTVTGSDVVATANVSVGNLELLPDTTRDYVIAGNVAPANEPGLGEPGDPNPPGRNADGSFTITGSDVVAIANAAVGNLVPIVGQPIPGRNGTPGNRVILGPDLTIVDNRVLRADTVYEVRGTLRIAPPNSDPSQETTLTIEPGTRLEFDPASNGRLVVALRANLVAIGTRLQPIVFTCASPTPLPGCWGGVFINGLGVLNNGDTGGGGGTGFPILSGPYGTGLYGGIQVGDSSGVLRYVRIQFAGSVYPGVVGATPALSLNGVGSATRLDSIQVLSAAGDGIAVSGGSAQLRHVLVTEAGDNGIRWADGWQGKGQFLVITLAPDAVGDGLRGRNYLPRPDALPRSVPQLSHLTLLGPAGAVAARGISLDDGSGLLLFNSIVQRFGTGFDVDGASSCGLSAAELQVAGSIIFGSIDEFSTDTDCFDEPAFVLEPSRVNRVVDPGLLFPFRKRSPDWRPGNSAPAATGGVNPPLGSFFVAGLSYVGAVEPANLTTSNVPWYAGWTVGVGQP